MTNCILRGPQDPLGRTPRRARPARRRRPVSGRAAASSTSPRRATSATCLGA